MEQRQVYTDTAKIRVYFEGVLFPYAKSVVITEGIGNVSAQIEVPPSVRLLSEQWTGMMCHVFYANKRVLSEYPDPGNAPPPAEGWPILFQGELSGESSNASVQSENVMLTFASHSRHFDQTLLYFYDPARNASVVDIEKQAHFIGNSRINIDTAGTLSRRTQILTSMTRRIGEMDQDTERNIAFSSTVLELLRTTGDQHAMFNYFDKKLKLSKRFAAYADPDVGNILKLNQLKHLVDQRAQALPSFTSVMQLLDIATGIMKYNWNQLSQPRLRPTQQVDQIEESAEDVAEKIYNSAKTLIDKGLVSRGPFQMDVGNISLPADYAERVRNTQGSDVVEAGIIPIRSFVNKVFLQYIDLVDRLGGDDSSLLTQAFQDTVDSYNFPTYGDIEEPETDEGDTIGDQPAPDFSGNSDGEEVEVEQLLKIDQALLQERDELNEFTVTPNMEFAQPPKCNVLFPASFTNYGLNRNAFQEPTRLYARVNIAPASQDQQQTAIEWYIAPTAQAYHLLTNSGLTRYQDAYEKRLKSMPHKAESLEGEPEDDQGEEYPETTEGP